MFRNSTTTASFSTVVMAALIFSLSLPGVFSAQGNPNLVTGALASNTTGIFNTAIGFNALGSNTTGNNNTATGLSALFSNTTGFNNTANGFQALVFNTAGGNNTATGVQALFS